MRMLRGTRGRLTIGLTGAVAALAAGPAAAGAAGPPCSGTCRFVTPGVFTPYLVPDGVRLLHVQLAGGRGGDGDGPSCPGTTVPGCISSFRGRGGRGALVGADLPVEPGQVLQVMVGGDGRTLLLREDSGGALDEGAGVPNGGDALLIGSGGGGGSSSISTAAVGAVPGKDPRLVVAGGGGGGGRGIYVTAAQTVDGAFDGGDAGRAGRPLGGTSVVGSNAQLGGGTPGTLTAPGRQGPGDIPRSADYDGRLDAGGDGGGGGGYYGGGGAGALRRAGGSIYVESGAGGGSSFVAPGATPISIGTNPGAPFVLISPGPVDPATLDRTTYELVVDGSTIARAENAVVTRLPAFILNALGVTGGDQALMTLKPLTKVGGGLDALIARPGKAVLAGAILTARNPVRPTQDICLYGIHDPATGVETRLGKRVPTLDFGFERQQVCTGTTRAVPGVTAEVLTQAGRAVLRIACLRPAACRGSVSVDPVRGEESTRLVTFDLPSERERIVLLPGGPLVWRGARIVVREAGRAPAVNPAIVPAGGLVRPAAPAPVSRAKVQALLNTLKAPLGTSVFSPPPPLPPPPPPAPQSPTATTLTSTCPAGANPGSPATVGGVLSPAVAGLTVTVTYKAAGVPDVVHAAVTAADGSWSDAYTPSAAGTTTVSATFAGTPALAASAAPGCSIPVTRIATTLSATCPETGSVGVAGSFGGTLGPALAGEPVTVTYVNTLLPMSTPVVHQVVTGPGGAWTDSFTPSAEGRHDVTASYAGSARHAGSSSEVCFHFVN